MRMRKKKWTAPYLETREDVMVFHPEEYKGKWRDVVKGNLLHVEIGSGKGDLRIPYFILDNMKSIKSR